MVVSVEEKEYKILQVGIKETNESELLEKMSKVYTMTSKLKACCGYQDKHERYLCYCSCGVRHIDGVNLIQASVRNMRICRSDEKGEIQVEALQG